MKIRLFSLIFFLSWYTAQAQEEASIWYFGEHAGLDFSSGAPVVLTDGALDTLEGCATISDTDGNLLFYTDGTRVYNRNHQIMANGTDLNGARSSTQSAIIVPKSDEPNVFYIFTVDEQQEANGLQYSVLDMNLNGGLGDITTQKNIALQTPVCEKLTAVENANGNGVWVIAKDFNSDTFWSYLVDASGVSNTPVISNIGFAPISTDYREGAGYLKTSPDGRFLASATHAYGVVELFRFNSTTGAISDLISLQDFFNDFNYNRRPYGIEFSPNNQVLYVSNQAGVYQFDISNYDRAAILASGIRISPFYGIPPFPMAIQMAIDGKLYINQSFQRNLMVINNPNVLGPGCNFVENGVNLGPTARGGLGLPPFITSFFTVGIKAENFCLGGTTDFSINVSEPIISISWDFGDGNTSTMETPSHTYATSGDYTVSVTAMTATGSSTDTKEITIYDVPTANLTDDFEVCTGNVIYEFDLATKDSEVLGPQLPSEFQVSYFPSLSDAENNSNLLPSLYTNTLTTETIFARIQNTNNPACFDTVSFDLVIQKAPIVNIQEDWTVCDADLDGLYTFDLSQKTTSIVQNNNVSEFSVSFYSSQPDLDNKTNPLPLNYTNTAPREEIFWRIENNTYPDCYGEGTFFIEVISGVTANAISSYEVCDNNNDGIFTFELNTKEPEILGAQNAASVVISFHSTLVDAESGDNPLNKIGYTNSTAYTEVLYARIENNSNSNCYDTTSLVLEVSDSPLIRPVSDWQVCDDNNDGTFAFDLSQKDMEIFGNQAADDFTITYHRSLVDAQANQNTLLGNLDNTSNPQTVFFRMENNTNTNCFITGDFALEVYDRPTAYLAAPIVQCDTDELGSYTFDLSLKDIEVLNGQDGTAYSVTYFGTAVDATNNQNPLSKTNYENTNLEEFIYARVQHTNLEECFAISDFQISIRPLPQPNLEETYVICPDSPELTIDGGDFESWIWRDANDNPISTERTLEGTSLGDFTLTVSESSNGLRCEKTVPFEIVSSGAPEDFTTEIKGFSDQITIEVDVIGLGDFEYSTDGESYQASNGLVVFPGVYTVYVRDTFLCRTISKEVIALGYQKFFTPNNDGTNEYWHIIGVENFPESKTFIYDRYGKLLQQLSPDTRGWDGTFQSLQMPSTDYWFRFENEDGKIFTGHFSLKR